MRSYCLCFSIQEHNVLLSQGARKNKLARAPLGGRIFLLPFSPIASNALEPASSTLQYCIVLTSIWHIPSNSSETRWICNDFLWHHVTPFLQKKKRTVKEIYKIAFLSYLSKHTYLPMWPNMKTKSKWRRDVKNFW